MLANTTTSRKRDLEPPFPATIPWLVIERASNGYLVRDSAVRETWLIADEDWFEGAAALLAEINARLGGAGDAYDERRILVSVEPGEQWSRSNAAECLHDRVRNTSSGASGLWACVCGVEFVPLARPIQLKPAA